MHMGVTSGAGLDRPFARIGNAADGAVSPDSTVMGTYLHGVFAADAFRRNFIGSATATSTLNYEAIVDATLDALAAHLERHLDLDDLLSLAR
jgi:adenosylcobyric acid synthase